MLWLVRNRSQMRHATDIEPIALRTFTRMPVRGDTRSAATRTEIGAGSLQQR